MNFDNIKEIIQNTDLANFEQPTERRSLLKNIGTKILAASVPLVGSAVFNKAHAQTTNNIITALNQLLKIERLLFAFFDKATQTEGLMTPNLAEWFGGIGKQDMLHVKTYEDIIDSLSGSIDPEPAEYDFTGGKGLGGPFPYVFKKYDEFAAVAQILKDTSVRAYIGLLPVFMPKNEIISKVAAIHSVEARHAGYIRYMRVDHGIDPWITLNTSGIDNPAAIPAYEEEQNTIQGDFEIVNINGFTINAEAASEAFDEPLTVKNAMAVYDKFIVS